MPDTGSSALFPGAAAAHKTSARQQTYLGMLTALLVTPFSQQSLNYRQQYYYSTQTVTSTGEDVGQVRA
jgi:hypothetical protein